MSVTPVAPANRGTAGVPGPQGVRPAWQAMSLHRQGPGHPQSLACAACPVRGAALFRALDSASLDRIHTPIDSVSLAADAPVFGRGATGTAVYTVRAGLVRFERVTSQGDRRIVRIAGRGDLIGQEALLHKPYADDAVACTPVQLCRIPRGLVEQLAENRALLLRELMLRWQQALDQAETWVSDLSAGQARRRVLHLLHHLAGHADADGSIWLPRRDEIGAMLDLTVETASRQVSALRREGVLVLVPGRSARLDAAALRRALLAADAG